MLDIQWSKPYTFKQGGTTKWRREWFIPVDMLSGFFAFWNKNRFKMLTDGFTVSKEKLSGKWFIYETKEDAALFKSYCKSEPKKIVSPDDLFILPPYDIKDKSGLRPWQVIAAGKLISAINHWGCGIDGSDTGCHAKGQLILMVDGSMKKVEDIVVGDLVMGWKGSQRVTELKRGRQQMAKVIPIRGDSFVVNIDHVLTVVLTNSPSKSHTTTGGFAYNSIIDIKVKEWLSLTKTTKHAIKLFSSEVHWDTKDLPISPYLIGALLGDGGLSSKSTVSFTSQDKELWDEIKCECKKYGWNLGDTSESITKRITNCPDLFKILRNYNLLPIACENRNVPFDYKTGDRYQRLEILAGLLDTDGHYYNSGGYEITLKSHQLSEDIVFLARSLGFLATSTPCKKKCFNNGVIGNYFRTNISGNIDSIPCRIFRKKARPRQQKKNHLRTGFKIELLPEDNYYGFSLDGDGRFLMGSFMVTHNTGKTFSACAVARELGYHIVVVCPKAVIKSWTKVLTTHFKLKDKVIGVTNYEKLRNGRTDSPIASYVLNRKTRRSHLTWKIPKKTLIIWDESQKLKNWDTKNAKVCASAIKEGFPMLFCSATNATNPLEMRAVGLALKVFKNSNSYYEWAYDHGVYKGNWGLEFNNDPSVLRRIHHTIFEQRGVRLRRDEIPNFPECEIIPQVYNMDDEDEKRINEIYDEMDKELSKLARSEKSDSIKAEKSEREQSELVIQLRARQNIELIKVPLFVSMIEEAIEEGFSVAVFVNFTETINALSTRLKTKCVFDGKTSDKIRDRNVELFQNDSERIILVNVQSGGAGLSLHDLNGNFPRMSIISPSYSPVFMRQALGRVWRDDAKTKCVQRIVCVANTVEEKVCISVQNKLNNLDMLNDGDLTYSKDYSVYEN